jgi:hypothetical protein
MKFRISILIIALLLTGTLGISLPGCGNSNTKVTDFSGITSASSKSANGLALTLSLDAATYRPGQTVSIVVDEKNTLSKTNDVPVADKWRLKGLTTGPCSDEKSKIPPFGIAVMQGYHTGSDISKINPLVIDNPNEFVTCPYNTFSNLTGYEFLSMSDTVKFTDPSDPTHSSLQQMYAQAQPNGYWTGADPDAVQHNFEPGVYTIVAGNEWGTLVLLHFTIAQ